MIVHLFLLLNQQCLMQKKEEKKEKKNHVRFICFFLFLLGRNKIKWSANEDIFFYDSLVVQNQSFKYRLKYFSCPQANKYFVL